MEIRHWFWLAVAAIVFTVFVTTVSFNPAPSEADKISSKALPHPGNQSRR